MALTAAAKKARDTAYIARAAFGVSLAASLAANVVASAKGGPIGIAIGLWVPLVFLLTVTLMERVQVNGRAGVVRKASMAVIAGIVGWVSYWHMVDVIASTGADTVTVHLLPLTVDIMVGLAQPYMKIKQPSAPRKAATRKNVTPITKARKPA